MYPSSLPCPRLLPSVTSRESGGLSRSCRGMDCGVGASRKFSSRDAIQGIHGSVQYALKVEAPEESERSTPYAFNELLQMTGWSASRLVQEPECEGSQDRKSVV